MKPFRPMVPAPGALPLPDHNSIVVLNVSGTVESVNVPAGATIARIIAHNGLAVVLANADPPAVADLKDGTAGVAVAPGDPLWLEIEPGMVDLRFNSAGTPTLGISFWGKAG